MSARKLKFEISNLGPIESIKTEIDSGQLKTAIFAINGTGKTFISRAFNLIDKYQKNETVDNIDRFININQNDANFLFDYYDSTTNNEMKWQVKRGQKPTININSNLLVHVFNREFVVNNVEINHYALNSSNINGEILIGNETIDVAKEEKELADLTSKKENLKKYINKDILNTKQNIENLGIRRNLTEFVQINFENLFKQSKYIDITFEKAKDNYTVIKNIPENIEKIKGFDFTFDNDIQKDFLTLIAKTINVSSIGEDFKQKIIAKSNFIQKGLQLIDKGNNKCPFCEQDLDSRKELIDKYIDYFNQEEAKFEEEIQELLKRVVFQKNALNSIESNYNAICLKYTGQKKYFSDLGIISLQSFPDYDNLKNAFDNINKVLHQKSLNKNQTTFEIDYNEAFSTINSFFENLEKIKNELNTRIEEIEEKKQDISSEQTNSRRIVCLSAFGELFNRQEKNVIEYKNLIEAIEKQNKIIKEKRNQNKLDKKTKVNEVFEKYLKRFFNDKYKYDKDKQCLIFENKYISQNAKDVLSDGEKNIIGFCYYLALTHQKIKQKSDYQNLLFIIDDPISSMDYHYVYQVADIIKHLNIELEIENRFGRFITLTHNFEFMNLLIKNKISSLNLYIQKNEIKKINKELICPYNEHLKAIKNIAEGNQNVTYQTPNSIRHVIETIKNFVAPDKTIDDFINEENILCDCEQLRTLIQDLSHGRIRYQKSFTEQDIIDGCKQTIKYIEENYSGQLNILN